jgi:hypothetical protein
MLSGSRIDILCAKYQYFPLYTRPAMTSTTQERPREAGQRLQWTRGREPSEGGITPNLVRCHDKWFYECNSLN